MNYPSSPQSATKIATRLVFNGWEKLMLLATICRLYQAQKCSSSQITDLEKETLNKKLHRNGEGSD
jgi:hypothetical protein